MQMIAIRIHHKVNIQSLDVLQLSIILLLDSVACGVTGWWTAILD